MYCEVEIEEGKMDREIGYKLGHDSGARWSEKKARMEIVADEDNDWESLSLSSSTSLF